MITQEKSQRLLQLVEAYRAAAVDESWKGSGSPLDIQMCEQDLANAKNDLDAFIASITANRDTIHLPQNMRQARAMLAVASMFLQEHGPKKPRSERALPPDPDDQNDARAGWAGQVLDRFQIITGADSSDALSDLLADLMHWCDRNNQGFDTELQRARGHYEEETK
jgi:hypothetical protein